MSKEGTIHDLKERLNTDLIGVIKELIDYVQEHEAALTHISILKLEREIERLEYLEVKVKELKGALGTHYIDATTIIKVIEAI